MKRAMLVFGLLALAMPAAATTRWGVVAVGQSSRLVPGTPVMETGGPPPTVLWSPSGGLGALVSWHGAGPLTFEAEPTLIDQRDRLDYGATTIGPYQVQSWSNIRLTQIALPLRAVWAPVRALRLSAGPEVRYLARATSTSQSRLSGVAPVALRNEPPRVANAIIFEDIPWTTDVTSFYQRWGVGASIGVGTAWAMGEHEGRLDARWVRGFTDTHRGDLNGRPWEGFQAAFGVLW